MYPTCTHSLFFPIVLLCMWRIFHLPKHLSMTRLSSLLCLVSWGLFLPQVRSDSNELVPTGEGWLVYASSQISRDLPILNKRTTPLADCQSNKIDIPDGLNGQLPANCYQYCEANAQEILGDPIQSKLLSLIHALR